MQKKNREEKKKRKEAHLPGPPRPNLPLRSPAAGPAHLPFCRLPPRAPKQLGVDPERTEDATAPPTRFQAPQLTKVRQGDAHLALSRLSHFPVPLELSMPL